MEVVFIRHGQTTANALHRHQTDAETLSDTGVASAEKIGRDLASWRPTHIITSPLTRAVQTADCITKHSHLPVFQIEELRELRRPLYLLGKKHLSVSSFRYIVTWFFTLNTQYDDIKNGESYYSFRKRLERARSLLEQYPEDARIVVISHSIFINFFVEHVCNTRHISFIKAVPRLLKVLSLKNTHATQLVFQSVDENSRVCAWELKVQDIPVKELT